MRPPPSPTLIHGAVDLTLSRNDQSAIRRNHSARNERTARPNLRRRFRGTIVATLATHCEGEAQQNHRAHEKHAHVSRANRPGSIDGHGRQAYAARRVPASGASSPQPVATERRIDVTRPSFASSTQITSPPICEIACFRDSGGCPVGPRRSSSGTSTTDTRTPLA